MSGTITLSGTPVSGATVFFYNSNQDDSWSVTTNSNGRYLYDLANRDDYSDGDVVTVVAYIPLFTRQLITSLPTSSATETRFTIDITLSNNSIGTTLVPDAGLNEVRDWLGGSSATAPTHIEWNDATGLPISTDTYSTWDTGSSNEERNAVTSKTSTTYSITYKGTLLASELDGVDVTKSGLFNAASDGTIYAEILYGAISKTTTFQVREEDTITIS
jgi:hypothetical protein